MPSIPFSIGLRYSNGTAAPGIDIQIVDLDADGEDVLWEGQTDEQGIAVSQTGEWRDHRVERRWVVDFLDTEQGKVPSGGKWETASAPDPEDLPVLEMRVGDGRRRWTTSLPFEGGEIKFESTLPWQAGASRDVSRVLRSQRALVVISELVAAGEARFAWLYEFLNRAGIVVAEQILGDSYRTIVSLRGADATGERVLKELACLGSDPAIRTVDVILNVHGLPGRLVLMGSTVDAAAFSAEMGEAAAGKLRLMYNTACHGASHGEAFVGTCFAAAAGAKGVNANSPTEYPAVLALWAAGASFGTALAAGNAAVTRIPLDLLAARAGFDGVDSDKQLFGDPDITISTPI